MADYADDKGCTTAYVYGQNDQVKRNPSYLQQPLISSSFARHDISVNFEYQKILHNILSHKEVNAHTRIVFICLCKHLGIVMTTY